MMSIKAIKPDGTFINIDIPEHKLMSYERDIEVYVPEGKFPRYKTVINWCRKVGIKCTECETK